MRSNLDAMTRAPAGTPGPIERNQPEARKDRWMLELERAAMAEGDSAKSAPRSASAQGTAHAAPRPAQVHGAARADTRRHAAHAPAPAFEATSRAQDPPERAAGAPLAGLMACAAAPGVPARSAPAPQHGAQDLPAPLWSAATALSLPAAVSLARLAGIMDSAQDGPAPGAAPAVAAPDGEDFARSLLHVYHADDGVHAWLRDASLSPVQARRVANAVAAELAQGGTPLAALTVNGKKIRSSGAAGDHSGRHAAGNPDEAAPAVRPLTQFAVKGA